MRISDFELQTRAGQLWIDIQERLAEKDAIIAAKDAEIFKLQPGYVEPEQPTVAKRIEDAVMAVLTDDEKITYAKEIEAVKVDIAAAEVAVKAKPPEKETPIDEKPQPVESLKPVEK